MIEGSRKACQTQEFKEKMSRLKKGIKLTEYQIQQLCESHWNNNYLLTVSVGIKFTREIRGNESTYE